MTEKKAMFGYWRKKYDCAMQLVRERDATITSLKQERDAIYEQYLQQAGLAKQLKEQLKAEDERYAKLAEQLTDAQIKVQGQQKIIESLQICLTTIRDSIEKVIYWEE